MDWVYMLECGDGSLYTGWTNDLARRLAAHQSGRGAKYTRGRAPVRLVYAEQCTDKSAALRREAAVKALPRARKLELARQWETEEKAMAVAMDSQEARRRMEEGRLYLPGDEAIMAEQMDCLEKQYDYNATRPHEQERRAALLREMGHEKMPLNGWLPTMVPGAPAAWGALRRRFGSMSMEELMGPAMGYAREGFPVALNVHRLWLGEAERFRAAAVMEQAEPISA